MMNKAWLLVLSMLATQASAAAPPALSWIAAASDPRILSANAVAVTADAAGNIYAAGSAFISVGFFPDTDIIVASFDRLGVQRWVRLHDGSERGVDKATSISTDAAGNVYVTGYENSTVARRSVLLKYAGDGTLLWERRYTNGTAGADITKPALDASGNLYFVVFAAGVQSLVSLDPAGGERFSRVLAAGFGYRSTAIAPDGTLVVAAGVVATRFLKFDLSGNQLSQGTGAQLALGSGSALAFGPDAEVFVATGEVLTKFDATGTEAWHFVFAGPTSPATCVCTTWDLVVDVDGQATLLGESFAGFRYTLEVIRLNRAGGVVWRDSYSPMIGGGGGAGGGDVVLGKAGSVDVVGWEAVPGAAQWFVVRYAADGVRVPFPGPALLGEAAAAVRVGDDGLVVAGYASDPSGGRFTVARYGVDAPAAPPVATMVPVPAVDGWALGLLAAALALFAMRGLPPRRR